MMTTVQLRDAENDYIKEMNNYVKRLRKQQRESRDIAYEEAKQALIRTGALNNAGKAKRKIVSWE